MHCKYFTQILLSKFGPRSRALVPALPWATSLIKGSQGISYKNVYGNSYCLVIAYT